jgi:hypothetical protein
MGLFAAILFSPSYETRNATASRRLHLLLLLPFYFGFLYLNYHAQIDNYTYAKELLNYTADLEARDARGLKLVQISFQRGWLIPYLGPIYICVGAFSGLLITAASIVRPRSKVSTTQTK